MPSDEERTRPRRRRHDGLLPPPVGNIAEVRVGGGGAADRDDRLDDIGAFEVVTDSGHRYEVTERPLAEWGEREWRVVEIVAGGDRIEVGRVRHPPRRLGQLAESNYRFRRAGAWFDGGAQSDLWNAVQSLTE